MTKKKEPPTGNKIIKFTSSNALLKKVDQRPQGNKENKGNKDSPKKSFDLKFSCAVEKQLLKYLAAGDGIPDFWYEHGKIRYPSFTAIGSRLELKDSKLVFGDLVQSKLELSGVTIKGFKFEAVDSHALDISFTATVLEPDDAAVLAITHANGQKMELYVECDLGPIGQTVSDGKDDDNQGGLLADEE